MTPIAKNPNRTAKIHVFGREFLEWTMGGIVQALDLCLTAS